MTLRIGRDVWSLGQRGKSFKWFELTRDGNIGISFARNELLAKPECIYPQLNFSSGGMGGFKKYSVGLALAPDKIFELSLQVIRCQSQ